MNELTKRSITGLVLIAFVWLLFQLPSYIIAGGFIALLFYVLLFEWPQLAHKTPLLWLVTPLYPILPFLVLAYTALTPSLLLLLLVIVCSHDSGAYFAGKLMGKHKIAPSISPGKSWEGFIGGCVISLLATCALMRCSSFLFLKGCNWGQLVVFTLLLNVAAVTGDLFESYLKRRAGLKDSGAILPGHGGVLDRFDSILCGVMVMTIFFYTYAK